MIRTAITFAAGTVFGMGLLTWARISVQRTMDRAREWGDR